MLGITRFACGGLLTLLAFGALGDTPPRVVEHYDPLHVDPTLDLARLIDKTVAIYPDGVIVEALRGEAEALKQRGESWFSGPYALQLTYIDDSPASSNGLREVEGYLQVQLWNWGQRTASQQLAERAAEVAEYRAQAIRWHVAGRVRAALWDLALRDSEYQTAQTQWQSAQRLVDQVRQWVEAGESPRADLLLAQSYALEQQSRVVQAEAEVMHARQRYTALTQDTAIPANYRETQTLQTEITTSHPALAAVHLMIERHRAQIAALDAYGSGATTVGLGGKTERASGAEAYNDSMTFYVNFPFGGSVHRAPQIAAVQLELAQAQSEREHLWRQLQTALHEATHQIEVDRAELELANRIKNLTEEHLQMAEISLHAGEMSLLDFLKIQAKTNEAIQAAARQDIQLQRDIALYNQALGVLP